MFLSNRELRPWQLWPETIVGRDQIPRDHCQRRNVNSHFALSTLLTIFQIFGKNYCHSDFSHCLTTPKPFWLNTNQRSSLESGRSWFVLREKMLNHLSTVSVGGCDRFGQPPRETNQLFPTKIRLYSGSWILIECDQSTALGNSCCRMYCSSVAFQGSSKLFLKTCSLFNQSLLRNIIFLGFPQSPSPYI